jgi:hypothetical protein
MLRAALSLSSIIALSLVSASAAEDTESANWVMPGCRAFLEGHHSDEQLRMGVCAGIIDGIVFDAQMSKGLLKQALVCPPPGATLMQEVRVVVAHIDQNPAESHVNFKYLAVRALHIAWPCKD